MWVLCCFSVMTVVSNDLFLGVFTPRNLILSSWATPSSRKKLWQASEHYSTSKSTWILVVALWWSIQTTILSFFCTPHCPNHRLRRWILFLQSYCRHIKGSDIVVEDALCKAPCFWINLYCLIFLVSYISVLLLLNNFSRHQSPVEIGWWAGDVLQSGSLLCK